MSQTEKQKTDILQAMRQVEKLLSSVQSAWTPHDYQSAVISLLRRWLPFYGSCCTAVDPLTLLSTGALTEDGVEAIHAGLFESDYRADDYNKYETLAADKPHAAALSQATKEQPLLSARFRETLQPAGFGDELRAALVWNGSCWGYLTLFRRAEQPYFSIAEEAFLAALIPSLARGMRQVSLNSAPQQTDFKMDSEGIMTLDSSLKPLAMNEAARHLLNLLRRREHMDEHTLPRPIRSICTRALKGTKGQDKRSHAKALIRLGAGAYTVLQASRLTSASGELSLAVTFKLAKPTEALPLLAEAWSLTEREQQIAELVMGGFSTKEMASALLISAYTVQDHLKSIFSKTGVSSRRSFVQLLIVHV